MGKLLLYIIFISFFSIARGEEYLGKETVINNFGKEFLISIPPNLSLSSEDLDTISLIFASPFDTKILVENPSFGYSNIIDLKSYVPLGLDLNSELVQTISQTAEDSQISQIVRKNIALRISSDEPISVFVLSKFAETAEGFLAFPVERLGREYVLSNYTEPDVEQENISLPALSSIVACGDTTVVSVTFGGTLSGKYVTRLPQNGYTLTKTLDKGDVWMISNIVGGKDLSGSYVQSDKSISIISANQCANVPLQQDWCNYLVNQEIPMKYWGKSYLVPRLEGSSISPIVRIFSTKEDGEIYLNDTLLSEIEGEGVNFEYGFWEIDTELSSTTPPYILISQDEMMCVIYGRGADGEEENLLDPGGPFMMSLSPNEAMQEEILFSTPNHSGRISFFENYLSISGSLENGNIPDYLEIASWQNTHWLWKSVNYSNLIVSADAVGENLFSLNLKLPYPGYFKIRSPGRLKAYVYGMRDYNSYGYPASYPLFISNGKDKTAPLVSWEITCDGIIRGVVTDDNLVERTLFDSPNSFNVRNWNVIDKQVAKERRWEIEIEDPAKDARATVRFWDEYGNSAKIEINYTAPKIKGVPSIIQLGTINIGKEVRGDFHFVNQGGKDFILSKIYLPENPTIKIFYNGSPYNNEILNLAAGDSLEFEYEFSSLSEGNFDFFIRAGDDCLNKKMIRVVFSVSPPIIYASDSDFPTMVSKRAYSTNVFVENKMGAELEIYSFTPPSHTGILVNGLNLNNGEALFLAENTKINYTLSFYGDTPVESFLDSIIFHSNAKMEDSVCLINIEVFERGVVAQDLDFGRRPEIDGIYRTESYLHENGLSLVNEGPEAVEIIDITFLRNDNNSFTFSTDASHPFIIPSGDSVKIDIEWMPQSYGHYKAEIEIITTTGTNLSRPIISGIATRPKIKIVPLDFGVKIIDDINAPFIQFISITNLSKEEWEFSDTLRYFELNTEDIETELEKYGVEINTSLLNNLELQAGDIINLPVTWKPKIVGGLPSFNFEVSTEAIIDGKLIIDGVARETALEPEFSYYETSACAGASSLVEIVLYNFGDEPLILNPLRLELTTQAGSFGIDADFTQEFEIEANSSAVAKITYTSNGSDARAKLIVKIKNKIDLYTIELFGQNLSSSARASLLPGELYLDPNQSATLSIGLSGVDDLSSAEIDSLSVFVYYNKSYFIPDFDKLELSAELSGKFSISPVSDALMSDYFRIDLTSYGLGKIGSNTELFSLPITGLFPNTGESTSQIYVEIDAQGNNCVLIERSQTTSLSINEYCLGQARNFKFSGYGTNISEPNQNPISSSFEINYSVGISANVEIGIFNYNGTLVQAVTGEYHEAGEYSFIIDPSAFSSGVYYLRMSTLDFSISHNLLIVK